MSTRVRLLLLTIGFLFVSSAAYADSIGPNCGTCQGSIYTLNYIPTPIKMTPTTQTFAVTFTINTATYNGGGNFIDQVAIKVSSSVIAVTLASAPNGASNWTLVPGGINAGGCSGHGSGFVCASANSLAFAANVSSGGTFHWTFDVTVATGTLLTGTNQASIKARYTDANGNKVGALVSEDITLQPSASVVPEPGTLILLGSGLLGVAQKVRRRLTR